MRPLRFSVCFLAMLAANCIALLWLNHGKFIYILDDPYIHLAFSEDLRQFHFGLNAGEAAAPSSSILWPFLLAPWAEFSFHEYVPLLLNVILAVLTALLIARVFEQLGVEEWPARRHGFIVAVAAVTLGAFLCLLVLMGMEHTLQVLCAVAAMHGAILFLNTGRAPAWWPAAVVLGPLVRYESATITAAVLFLLLLRRCYRLAMGLTAASALPVAAYSLLLLSVGLQALPSSVLSKLVTTSSAWAGVRHRLYENFALPPYSYLAWPVLFLAAAAGVALLFRRARSNNAPVLWMILIAGLGYIAGGIFYFRYVLFLYAFLVPATAYVCRRPLARVIATHPLVFYPLFLPFAAAALAASAAALVVLPLASNNIYEQQYQMHRFLVEFHKGPVAVNDLGWTSYRNPHYVLDLQGLGSEAAREARLAAQPGWMDTLVREKHIPLVMIYPGWFPGSIPPRWQRVATLRLGRARISSAFDTVWFFDPDQRAVPDTVQKLQAFKKTLPEGVSLSIHGGT